MAVVDYVILVCCCKASLKLFIMYFITFTLMNPGHFLNIFAIDKLHSKNCCHVSFYNHYILRTILIVNLRKISRSNFTNTKKSLKEVLSTRIMLVLLHLHDLLFQNIYLPEHSCCISTRVVAYQPE